MLCNFFADSFHTKKLCSRFSSSEVRFYTENGRQRRYDVHVRLFGKRVVDFLLLVALFSLAVTAEALRANIGSKSVFPLQRGQFDPKFQVQGVGPTNHSSCHKTRMNDLLCGLRMLAQFSFVLSQITRFTDGQTDIFS